MIINKVVFKDNKVSNYKQDVLGMIIDGVFVEDQFNKKIREALITARTK